MPKSESPDSSNWSHKTASDYSEIEGECVKEKKNENWIKPSYIENEDKPGLKCGYFCWTPGCLQRYNTPQCLLATLACLLFMEGKIKLLNLISRGFRKEISRALMVEVLKVNGESLMFFV